MIKDGPNRTDTGEHRQMSELDSALDRLGAAVSKLISASEAGGPGKGASFRHKDVSIWLRNGSALAFGAKLNDAWAHLVEGVNSNTLDSRRISVSQWGWSQLMNPKEL